MSTWETIFGFIVLFVLGMGLFTIINLVIKLFKSRRSGIPKNQNPPLPPMQKGRIFIDGFAFEGHFSMPSIPEADLKYLESKQLELDKELVYGLYGIVPLTLEQLLEKALGQEDYEYAAKIRDRIKARKANEIH